MLGERVTLADDVSGRIGSFVAALGRLPAEPQWAVVGGFAVNIRIAHAHRPTNGLDTVSRDHIKLVDILVTEAGGQQLAAARVALDQGGTDVNIDVMSDTADVELPAESSERAFFLARRMAIDTAEPIELLATQGPETVATVVALVATVPSLVALKTVALPRRADSNNPAKVGSDIHDLVRLIEDRDLGTVAEAIASHNRELSEWVGVTLVKWFSPTHDLRYTQARLRRLDRSISAQAVAQDELAVLALLGHTLINYPY